MEGRLEVHAMENCQTMEEWERAVGIHEHRGIKFSWLTPPSTWKELKQFEVRDDDIFVISYPKSGSHWLMEIIHLLQNGAQKDKINQSSLHTSLELCKDQISLDASPETALPGYHKIAALESPRIILTHCLEEFLPPQVWQKQPKIIYLVRNPKDLAVSMYHYVSQLLPSFLHGWSQFTDYFLSNNYFGGSWFRHVLGYMPHMKQENVLLVKYEDLYKDLKGVITQINNHLGCPFPRENLDLVVEASSFTERIRSNEQANKDAEVRLKLHKKLSKLFGTECQRKTNVGEWREFFNNEISEKFDQVYQAKMRTSGLTLDFELSC